MTDYIKQVADAVRKSIVKAVADVDVCNCCWEAVDVPEHCSEIAGDVDLDAIIASVPTPEPVAYLTYKGYLLHAGDPKVNEHSDPEPLYPYPPDAQAELTAANAEIDRLKAELKERENAD